MNINLIFDSLAQAASQAFRTAIQAAANILDATFTNNITVNISVGYGEINGTAEPSGGASAGPSSGVYDSYSQVRSWLAANAPAAVQSGIAAMPTTETIQGQSQVAVWRAQEKLMGQVTASDPGLDGQSGFASDISLSLLPGVALHELTHAMARINYGSAPDIFDLYRFSSAGNRLFQGGAPNSASYFSLDGGKTDLADYGVSSDPSDFLNASAPNDPFNEYYNGSTTQGLTALDIQEMESLGYQAAPPPVTDLSASTTPVIFNLETGYATSSLGQTAIPAGGRGTLIGSASNDTLIASTNEGSFTFDGHAGSDTVRIDAVGRAGATIGGGSVAGVTIAVTGTTISATNIGQVRFVDGTEDYDPASYGAEIARLYQAALGRAPDAVGLADWVLLMNQGTALTTIAGGFINSAEFQSLYPGASQNTNAFVTQLYSNVLHRSPDPAGFANWTNAINSGAITKVQALVGFSESPESQTDTAPLIQAGIYVADEQAAQVARLYYTTLDRAPDLTGLQNWVAPLEVGATSLPAEVSGFTGSAEFAANYGSLGNKAFVDLLYGNALHRLPDAAGEANWVTALNNGTETRNDVVLGFSQSPEQINALAPVIELNGIKFT